MFQQFYPREDYPSAYEIPFELYYQKGYQEGMRRMNTTPETTLFVGDQLFTDVWGANRAGIYSILVKQIAKHEEIQIVLKRKLEKIVLREYRSRK